VAEVSYILWCWMDMQEDESSGVVAHALTSQKPKKAKFRDLQNRHAHLPFLDGEVFIGGVRIVEMCQERRNMSDKDREYPWSRKGESYDEMFSEGPFDEEQEFDPEEADQRITQFVRSADELSGPPVEVLADQVAALMRTALRDLEAIMEGKPHNKVLATQLLLGQRARGLQQHDPEQWPLHAASSLLSGLVIRGAKS
jgi:hypothetical protein